jgi:hypothetical protein
VVIDLDVIVIQDNDVSLGRIGGEKRERRSHTDVGRIYIVSYYIAGQVRYVKNVWRAEEISYGATVSHRLQVAVER